MSAQDLLTKFAELNQWSRGKQVAPHKPLLVLYALELVRLTGERLIAYKQIDADLKTLLLQFSPTKNPAPQYPFWRLQRDGVWEVSADEELECRASNTDAKKSELLKKNARGGFLPEIFDALRLDPSLCGQVKRSIIKKFPEDQRTAVEDAVEKVAGMRRSTPPLKVEASSSALRTEDKTTATWESIESRNAEPTDDRTTLANRVNALLSGNLPKEPPSGNPSPRRGQTKDGKGDYVRDPKVVAWVLRKAAGSCELCREPAPFISASTGNPYLEVHHVVTLAEGGKDMTGNCVALCPNCHRRCHSSNDRSVAIQTLYRSIERLEHPPAE